VLLVGVEAVLLAIDKILDIPSDAGRCGRLRKLGDSVSESRALGLRNAKKG